MSKTSLLFHVVINTKYHKNTIPELSKRELYKYIFGILSNPGCKVLRINGIGNHLHILFCMPSTMTLASIMQSIKQSSSRWMLRNPLFPMFEGWGKEYFAITVSPYDKEKVIEYIKNQEKHHLGKDFDEEMKELIEKSSL